MIPRWAEVAAAIPAAWRDDGASDPVVMRALRRMDSPHVRRMVRDIDSIARIHDFGYGPARLRQSPYESVTRSEWDACYSQALRDHGYPILSRVHYRALRPFGWLAWRRNWYQMRAWGWVDYAAFLADPDKGYTGKGAGGVQ